MIISGTGHRPNKLNNEWNLKGPVSEALFNILDEYLRRRAPVKIISGLALGFDQIWAISAIRVGIPIIAAIPCIGQDKIWPHKLRHLYNRILQSDLVTPHYVSHPNCMQERNKWMVDNCDCVIACWYGTSGGTANCIKYARSQGVLLECIDPKNLKEYS